MQPAQTSSPSMGAPAWAPAPATGCCSGLVAFALFLAACGGDAPPGSPAGTGSAAPTDAAAADGTAPRILAFDPLTARIVRQLTGPGALVEEMDGGDSRGADLNTADIALDWRAEGRLWVGRPANVDPEAGLDPVAGAMMWQTPANARRALGMLAILLPPLLGADASEVGRRIRQQAERLAQVDAYGTVRVATLPPERRLLVVAGADLESFASHFRLDCARWDPNQEGDDLVAAAAELAGRMARAGVDAVFPVTGPGAEMTGEVVVPVDGIPPDWRPLADALAAHGMGLTIAPPLHTGLADGDGPWRGTLAGMLDDNITAVVRTLGGQVPRGGLAMRENRAQGPGPLDPIRKERPR